MKLMKCVGMMIFLLVQGCATNQTAQRLPREHEYKPKEMQVLHQSIQKTLDKTQVLSSLKMHSPVPN